jgi:hypothetical protein
MTRRFWLHVSVSAALAVAVCLFFWLRGNADPFPSRVPGSPGARTAVLILTLAFLFFFARLLLRSTGSDRTMGLLGLYAAILLPPLASFVATSMAHSAAVLLLTAALVEILDADLAGSSAVRSGLFVAAACVIEPAFVVPAAALLPVAAAVAWPRWKVPVCFALMASVPWVALVKVLNLGGQGTSLPSLRYEVTDGGATWWVSTLEVYGRSVRSLLQSEFTSPYAALALVGLVVATVRRMGPSRRAIAAAVWLFSILVVSPIALDERTASLLVPLQYLFLVLLASTGLAALAAMNPLHAGRRRMIPVAALFLLPPLVAWVKILV